MVLDKALILKGLAGVATLGGTIGSTIIFRKELGLVKDTNSPDGDGQQPTVGQGASPVQGPSGPGVGSPAAIVPSAPSNTEETEDQKKDRKKNEVNAKLTSLGITGCQLEDSELTSSTQFQKECDLTKEKLSKIHFSNRGDNDVTVYGWGTENIKLKIENKSNNGIKYTFKNIKTRLTIYGDTSKTNISLPKDSEREFEEKEGKLSKVSLNGSGASNISSLNTKLTSLKIPDQCRFEEEESDTSIECDLSKREDLEKIKFNNKNEENKLTITGLTDGLKLKINRFDNEEGTRKHTTGTNLEFIFSGYSNEIKIVDSSNTNSDIVLKTNVSSTFTISDGSDSGLAKAFNSYALGFKVGLNCSGSSPNFICNPVSSGVKIKVLNSESNDIEEISVQESETSIKMTNTTEDVEGYEEGIKFTVTQPFPSAEGTTPRLEATDYQAKYIKGKGWGLVKKT